MNEQVQAKINSLYEKIAARLLPILQADLPPKIKLKTLRVVSRARVPGSRQAVFEHFAKNSDEDDAIRAVGELGGEDAAQALIQRVRQPHGDNRDVMADQLGRFKFPFVRDCLTELLGDPDRHVRYQAVFSLFNFGGRDAALALCRYISDPDEWISMNILKILCRMKEHESIPFLAEQFAKDQDLRRKAQMVSFLSMFRSVTLVNIFDEGLRSHDARLKANAIEAVGELELPQREIIARIEPYLEDPNNRIRANSVLALARSEPEKSRKVLVEMVESNDVQLRRSAAFILGSIPAQGNEPLAQKLVGDLSDDVRRRMVLSLKNFPADFAKTQIAIVLNDKNKWIRKHAVEIAAMYPEFPRDLILRLLKTETNYPNLVACMDFFGRHPDPEAVRIIRTKVKDKREPVVSGAIRSIGAMQGIPGLQAIAPQINYRDPQILRTFATTLFGLGSVEILDSVLDKAGQVKKPPVNDIYLPAVEGCLEALNSGDKMPKNLMAELTRQTQVVVPAPVAPPPPPPPEPVVVAPPPVAPAPVAPSALVPPVAAPAAAEIPAVSAATPDEAEPPDLDLAELAGLAQPEAPVAPEVPVAAPSRPVKPPKPRLPEAFTAGVKFFNLGKYKKARASFTTALEEKPDLAKAHFYLGMIAVEEKDWESVRDSLSTYLDLEPGNTKALLSLGRAFKALRDWPGVVRTLEQAVDSELSPKARLRVFRDLGVGNIFMKKYAEARKLLESAFREDPDDSEVNFHLAMACFHLQDLERADSLLRDLLRHLTSDDRLYSMAESLQEKVRAGMVAMNSGPAEEEEEPAPKAPRAGAPVNGVFDISDAAPLPPTVSDGLDLTIEDGNLEIGAGIPETGSLEEGSGPIASAVPTAPESQTTPETVEVSPPGGTPGFLDLSDLKLDPLAPPEEKKPAESADLFDLSSMVTKESSPPAKPGDEPPAIPDVTDLDFEPLPAKKPATPAARKPVRPASPRKPGSGGGDDEGGPSEGGKGPDFSLPPI